MVPRGAGPGREGQGRGRNRPARGGTGNAPGAAGPGPESNREGRGLFEGVVCVRRGGVCARRGRGLFPEGAWSAPGPACRTAVRDVRAHAQCAQPRPRWRARGWWPGTWWWMRCLTSIRAMRRRACGRRCVRGWTGPGRGRGGGRAAPPDAPCALGRGAGGGGDAAVPADQELPQLPARARLQRLRGELGRPGSPSPQHSTSPYPACPLSVPWL